VTSVAYGPADERDYHRQTVLNQATRKGMAQLMTTKSDASHLAIVFELVLNTRNAHGLTVLVEENVIVVDRRSHLSQA